MNYLEIFQEANIEAQSQTFEKDGRNVMIYPCGFAWIYFPGGKRNPIGKEYSKLGLASYDDYRKQYHIWISGEYNQSMIHKETHAQILAKLLTEKLGTEVRWNSRID